jgi:hypothetical protein
MLGGRWAQVTGFCYGKRWVRVPRHCEDEVDEDWRNVVKICDSCRFANDPNYAKEWKAAFSRHRIRSGSPRQG